MHRVKEQMSVYQRECTGYVHTALDTHKKSKHLCILSNNGPKGEAGMNHSLTKDKDYSVWLKEQNKTKNTDEALFYVHKPIGVSEYMITKNLPDEFRSSLPSIEEIEAELSGGEES